MAKLKELGTIVTGNTPKTSDLANYASNDIPFVKPSDIADGCITILQDTEYYISEYAKDSARMLPTNSVLVTCIGIIGKVAINHVECAFNQQINAIIPDPSKCESHYLAYAIQAQKSAMQGVANAAVVPIMNKSQFSDIDIPFPPLQTQVEIAASLDKVSDLIAKHQQQLSKLDELVKSRFIELFGEYEPTTTLARYIAELRGGKSLAGSEICKNKVLKTGAATFGWFDATQFKYLPLDYVPLPEHRVETGDVIISRMNTPDLVGACSYVFEAPEDMYYPDRLWKVAPKEKTNPIFLWQLLWHKDIRKQIKEKSGGTSGTMHNISKPGLLSIKCIDAPIDLQNEFAAFVEQTDKLKLAVEQSLDKLEILKKSLMQEYFR